MNTNEKRKAEISGKSSVTIILYIAAVVVALIGLALLIDNIYMYKTTIDQYVAQGYPAADVQKSLIPAQLLPGIFQPVAVYWGIALILLAVGITHKKITKYIAAQADTENWTGADEEDKVEEDAADLEKPEFNEPEDEELK